MGLIEERNTPLGDGKEDVDSFHDAAQGGERGRIWKKDVF